jgi:hypothetical protein
MRTKIRVNGAWYKPVPWLLEDDGCDGCVFDDNGCINSELGGKFYGLCDARHEFEGMIFIPNTKEAMAAYVIRILEGNQEEDEP